MTTLTALVTLACFTVVIYGELAYSSSLSRRSFLWTHSAMETGSRQCGKHSAVSTSAIGHNSTGSLPPTGSEYSGATPVPSSTNTGNLQQTCSISVPPSTDTGIPQQSYSFLVTSPTDTGIPQQTHSVVVGASGKRIFCPDHLDAAIGDIIEFNFLGLNHTLTQSEFRNPCNPNGEFDTSFNQFNPGNESGRFLVRFDVKTSPPQWFHCSQTQNISHCNSGMVFGLNTAGKMDDFIENAVSATAVVKDSSFPATPWAGNSTIAVGRSSATAVPSASLVSHAITRAAVNANIALLFCFCYFSIVV